MTFYQWIYKTFKPIVAALYRIESEGVENIPEGGCILASNHTGFADVLVISAASTVRCGIWRRRNCSEFPCWLP